jgi:hypothetical protein
MKQPIAKQVGNGGKDQVGWTQKEWQAAMKHTIQQEINGIFLHHFHAQRVRTVFAVLLGRISFRFAFARFASSFFLPLSSLPNCT